MSTDSRVLINVNHTINVICMYNLSLLEAKITNRKTQIANRKS